MEGVYALEIGVSKIEVISFYRQLEPYRFGENQQLLADFFAPDSSSFLVKAEEKKIKQYYWMESKPAKSNLGWNTFGPWKVDQQLKELNISSSNLAILVRIRADDSHYLLPVNLYHSERLLDKAQPYRIIFRLGRIVRGGTYKIYEGIVSGLPSSQKEFLTNVPKRIGYNIGGATFGLSLDYEAMGDKSGWRTIIINLQQKNSTEKISFRLYFYHYVI